MKLLIVIVEDPDKIEPLMDSWYEHNISGATIIDSRGMGHVIADHYSIFSRFSDLTGARGGSYHNNVIFTVIEKEDLLEQAIEDVYNIIGDLNKPDTGLLFTLPIGRVEGLKTPLPDDDHL